MKDTVTVLEISFPASAPLVEGTRVEREGCTYEVSRVFRYASGSGVATALPVKRARDNDE